MANEGLKPFNSNPFLRVTDFAIPLRRMVIGLQEFDDSEDLAYIYKQDGTFIETKPGVPRDDPLGHYNHTMFAKVGPDIYSIDGGVSNFSIYKNGVGWRAGSGGAGYLTNYQKSLWLLGSTTLTEIDSSTGSQGAQKAFPWSTLRHRTNGTHHVYTHFKGNTVAPDWRYRHILSEATFSNEIVLMEMQETSPITPVNFLDVAINTDRVSVVSHNYVSNISTINIYDLSGVIKETIIHPGQSEMLLMNDDKLYASDAITGVVTMWDITEDSVTFEKIYTPAGSFSTPSPFVLYGNLAT